MLKRLHGNLAAAADRGPADFTELLLVLGVGSHGSPRWCACRFTDPARFSLVHGGKDAHRFPVPLRAYETPRCLSRQLRERSWVVRMMGARQVDQTALFDEFSLDRHVLADHLLRSIDGSVELDALRRKLAPFYSAIGRPSVDPELMIRILLVGCCFGIRSEGRLCDGVHLNLAYRWFCRLGLDGAVPDHPTFSKNRRSRAISSASRGDR